MSASVTILTRIKRSLLLDMQWILTATIPEKWKFLITKYALILAPYAFWKPRIQAFGVPGWNRTTYIHKTDRIAHLQSIFIDHSYLKNSIPPHGIIVDVGAHIGEFALMAQACLRPKQIISFEPVPDSFKLLEQNNQDTHYNIAIGSDAHIKLNVDQQTGMSSKHTTPNTFQNITVPCSSLDAIQELQQHPTIDLLKIDVEGMEYDVITSSPLTIQKSKHIVIEVTIDRSATAHAMETFELLRKISPAIELVHIGNIIKYADTGKQAAVDMLFEHRTL